MKDYIGIIKPDELQQLLNTACGENVVTVGTNTDVVDTPNYIEYKDDIDPGVLAQARSIIDKQVAYYLNDIKTKMIERITQVAAKSVSRRSFDPNIDINAQQAQIWLNDTRAAVPSCVLSFALQNNCDNIQAANQIITQQVEYRKYLNDIALIKQQTLDNIANQLEYRKVKLVTQDGILALAQIEKL